MKKYIINPVTGVEEELIPESSKEAGNIEVLEHNVRELQGQLAAAQKRIANLNNEIVEIKKIVKGNPNDASLGEMIRQILS